MLDRQKAFQQVEDTSVFDRTVQDDRTMGFEQQALQILLGDAGMELKLELEPGQVVEHQ